MRGGAERRNVALAIMRRARGPSYIRNFSAGIGRGRGEGYGKYADADEPLFHDQGAPKEGFVGRGGALHAASGSSRAPGSSSAVGRGFSKLNQTHATETYSGALFSNVSVGRGSVSRNQSEDLFSDARPPQRPSLNLGSGGFGRGKPVEKTAQPEDIFSSDRRATLSSWSKWEHKLGKADTKVGPSPAELRLLQDESFSSALPFSAISQQQQGEKGQERQSQVLQSPAGASTVRAAPPQQRPPSPPGRQPIQQANRFEQGSPSYTSPSTGLQQPLQQPYYDIRFQQQPSVQNAPPPTGWQQPAQQPYYNARVQPQPSMQSTPPWADLHSGWQQPVQQPYEDARVHQQASMQSTPLPTGWQQQTVQQPYSDARFQQQPDMRYIPPPSTGRQPMTDNGRPPPAGGSMQVPRQPSDPVQPTSDLYQGQYLHAGESIEAPSAARTSSPSGHDYDWHLPKSKLMHVSVEEQTVIEPTQGHTGLDYEGKVEELYKENKLEQIDGIYGEMKAAQVRASAKTYGTILQSYLQLGKMDKVAMIYQEMSGVLFKEEKVKDENVKEISTASSVESPAPGAAASSVQTRSFGWDAQLETKYAEGSEGTFSRNMDPPLPPLPPPPSPDLGAKGFGSFGQPEQSVGRGMGRGMTVERHGSEPGIGTGMGRGKKVENFFNFDFSGGLGSAGQSAEFGKQGSHLDQESKAEVQDEYSQTFTPVIQPGWYAFAPEGISVGPGAGRGRPQSPQARGLGLSSSPPRQFGSGISQGSSSYEQRMQTALQQAPPRYSLDSRSLPVEPQFADPEEEPLESSVSEEEAEAAAERAMQILTEKRVNKFKNMFESDDQVVRRSSLGLARSLRERKQPKKQVQEEKAVSLTEEEQKKETERLKAIQQNEALQELQHTFDQFMKFYGEMAIEPEHELGDFTNPDIEEKPFMSLEEYLEKAKPNIMKTGLIRGEKEWQEMVKDTLRHLPYYEEFAERYGGPGRYTAKQENEDLEEIAGTLPSDVGRAAKSFVQRSLTTLKSNPGLNLHQKQWMLASMVDEFSQYIVND